jgi:hypothetical protein
MSSASYILFGVAVVILALMAWVSFGSKKKKWFKVYLANNDVMLLYRDLGERWWRTSDRYMRFKDEYGREVTFPSNAHWILMWESVADDKVETVKEEIRKMKEAQRLEMMVAK